MILTLENNQSELNLLKESLDEDYLTRAKAAAYVLDRLENVSMDVEQITHDPLTGLYTLDCFKEISTEILAKMPSGKVAAMVMTDLDFFKSINDTYGHYAGDNYLKTFSDILKSMPQEHFLPARRSGDEFCMLIFDCDDREQVIFLLDLFYQTLEENAIALSPAQTRIIRASCGFALADNNQKNISELLSHADQALYEVKRGGKGTYGEYSCSV